MQSEDPEEFGVFFRSLHARKVAARFCERGIQARNRQIWHHRLRLRQRRQHVSREGRFRRGRGGSRRALAILVSHRWGRGATAHPAHHLLVDDLATAQERTVGGLLLDKPSCCRGQNRGVDRDEAQRLHFRECFQHKGRQPRRAFLVLRPESRKRAVGVAVGQLPAIAHEHVPHDALLQIRSETANRGQVLADVHIGCQRDHVLLATPCGDAQQPLKPRDCRTKQIAHYRDSAPSRTIDDICRNCKLDGCRTCRVVC
mmetsp:Transcript_114453/g.363782  ORF Transcript_114453/g.363782 Transcript_114453/m.363782 type:complete len:257 (-) Transcript_114453:1657-2427(-)